jgi:hypothetical protein
MCPFCLTTVGLIVAGSVSTGGLAALAVKISRKKNSEDTANSNEMSPVEINPHKTSSP